MLKNGDFEGGWVDMDGQQLPSFWTLSLVIPGEKLYTGSEVADGLPECVHKLARQLPPNEQLGGANALILDGKATYKIFGSHMAFGAQLRQVAVGLEPGALYKLTAPVQIHNHGDYDPYGAEVRVTVNGAGNWVNAGQHGDRKWYRHQVQFVAPVDGVADVLIQFQNKWARKKDFFIDGVTLERVGNPEASAYVFVGQIHQSNPVPGEATHVEVVFLQRTAEQAFTRIGSMRVEIPANTGRIALNLMKEV